MHKKAVLLEIRKLGFKVESIENIVTISTIDGIQLLVIVGNSLTFLENTVIDLGMPIFRSLFRLILMYTNEEEILWERKN